MEVSGQLHDSTALPPRERAHGTQYGYVDQRLVNIITDRATVPMPIIV